MNHIQNKNISVLCIAEHEIQLNQATRKWSTLVNLKDNLNFGNRNVACVWICV